MLPKQQKVKKIADKAAHAPIDLFKNLSSIFKPSHAIPKFPIFRELTFQDKISIEQYTQKYPPYSDFNFLSLWSWSLGQNTFISTLNGNLVVKFNDYLTAEPFYTFIGTKNIPNTIKALMDRALGEGILPTLKLIPEISLRSAHQQIFNQYNILEDRDNFDYIYSIEETVTLNGNKLGSKRNFVNRFRKNYNSTHKILNLANPTVQEEIIRLFEEWRTERNIDPKEINNEFKAIKRFFQFAKFKSVLAIGLYIEDKLVGFSLNDIESQGYATNLFEKACVNYEGIFAYLRNITAQYLSKRGCQFLNHEQDMGIPGLRRSKLSYAPKFFLKKYTISANDLF